MTKRKASTALEDDNRNEQDSNVRVLPRSDGANNTDCDLPRLSENDEGDSNCPAPITLQIESSGGIVLDGTDTKMHSQQSDNQNDNSNSSFGTNNNTSNTNSGSNQQQPKKGKKERADNWSSSEIQLLHRGIESRRDIFYGPPSQATKKNRELAWESITKEVNAVSTTPRTISQVMKKFKNEKCRAKRKFTDHDKDGHIIGNGNNTDTNVSNSNNNSNSASTTINDITTITSAQQQTTSHNSASSSQQQQHQLQHNQAHLMPTTATPAGNSGEQMTTPSINLVKLAPQNVAKTMIDLPGHVQHTIQMPNDDMVLIVPPDMDGLLSGVNIVSDGNGHHHFQKCNSNALGNHQHSHHNQHALQALNNNQNVMNGTMSNGMVARTIPAGSMCSLVYSTGNEVCAPDHHLSTGHSTISSNHIAVSAQNLVHHRGPSLDQSQQQHQALHHPSQATNQQQQHQQQHPQQQHPQQQQLQQHQPHQHQQHLHSHHQQTHPPPTQHNHNNPHHHHNHHQNLAHTNLTHATPPTSALGPSTINGGPAVESQLKNLLFNLLLKDGHQSSIPTIINSNQDHSKQRNDMLAIIASSLTKIESHLDKISKVAGSLFDQSTVINETLRNQLGAQAQQLINTSASGSASSNVNVDGGSGTLSIGTSDNNNNSFNISNPGSTTNMTTTQRGNG